MLEIQQNHEMNVMLPENVVLDRLEKMHRKRTGGEFRKKELLTVLVGRVVGVCRPGARVGLDVTIRLTYL